MDQVLSKMIDIATEFGLRPDKDNCAESANQKYYLNLNGKSMFMRDSSWNYHGYNFEFKTPAQLRSLLKLIQHDI